MIQKHKKLCDENSEKEVGEKYKKGLVTLKWILNDRWTVR
jgi:hypothetical protein